MINQLYSFNNIPINTPSGWREAGRCVVWCVISSTCVPIARAAAARSWFRERHPRKLKKRRDLTPVGLALYPADPGCGLVSLGFGALVGVSYPGGQFGHGLGGFATDFMMMMMIN